MKLYVKTDRDDHEMCRIFQRVPRKYQGSPCKDIINLGAVIHNEFIFSQVSTRELQHLENGGELQIEIRVVQMVRSDEKIK